MRNIAAMILIAMLFQLSAPAFAEDVGSPGAGSQVKRELTDTEKEAWIGNLFDYFVTEAFVVLIDEDLTERVASVARKLVNSSQNPDQPIRLRIINDSLPIASSFPAGNLYVSSGLLDLLGNEEELAAALAIPIARLLAKVPYDTYMAEWKDRESRLVASQVLGVMTFLTGIFLGVAQFGALQSAASPAALQASQNITGVMAGLSVTPLALKQFAAGRLPDRKVFMNRLAPLLYSPPAFSSSAFEFFLEFYEGYEEDKVLKADAEAAVYLGKSGYDPRAVASFMERMLVVRNDYLGKGYVPSVLLAQPGLEKRIEHAKQSDRK